MNLIWREKLPRQITKFNHQSITGSAASFVLLAADPKLTDNMRPLKKPYKSDEVIRL